MMMVGMMLLVMVRRYAMMVKLLVLRSCEYGSCCVQSRLLSSHGEHVAATASPNTESTVLDVPAEVAS